MFGLLVCFLFVLIVLVIIKVSEQNSKIDSLEDQLNDMVTHQYLRDLFEKEETLKEKIESRRQQLKNEDRAQANK